MQISRFLPRTIALAGLAVVGAGAVQAQSITPVFIGSTGVFGDVTYTYQLFSTADTKVQTGDLFTMYDFNGLLTTGAQAPVFTPSGTGPNYSISIQNLGINPPATSLLAPDDPTQPNVTLTYDGTSPFVNPGPGSQFLGTLVLQSTNSINGAGDFTPFASSTTKNSDSTPAGNQGFLAGPNLGPGQTPEPGTLAMFVGMGISGAAFARRRKRRK
jgi:hypothetical protein